MLQVRRYDIEYRQIEILAVARRVPQQDVRDGPREG
jgi:hypothetical protein